MYPRTLALTMAALLAACGSDNDDNANSATVTLRVMETTDIHANVMHHNYYTGAQDIQVGLTKTASLIRQARAEVSNSVLVDNGDLLQGSPLGDYFAKIDVLQDNQVHPVYKAMNLLDYDVANIGNHEFNFGLDFLAQALDDAQFPYISANVFHADKPDQPYFEPYVIQAKTVLDDSGKSHTLNIGYIGFVPPQIMQWDKANLEGKVIAKDIVDMAEHYVPQMKAAGADLIIAIPHSGLDSTNRSGGDENASYYLAQVEGIDAILFGHAHSTFPGNSRYDGLAGVDNEKGTILDVPAIMPGFWGNHLGYIDLTLEKNTQNQWSVIDSESVLKPIYEKQDGQSIPLVDADSAVMEAVADDHNKVVQWVSEPFAKVSAPIHSFFALVQDDPSIQVVTDAQRAYTQKIITGTELDGLPLLSVGAPFRSGRGGVSDYTYLQAGDVSYGNVADLYIYPNTLKVLQLTGAEVKEWLEMSAGQFNQIEPGSSDQLLINSDFPSFNFDVIDGIQYQIDVTQPARYSPSGGDTPVSQTERIVNLTYQGKPIDLEQQFLLVSNNYRASGGGKFPNVNASRIVIDAPDENRQTVANYLIEETQKNPTTGFDPSADNNWQFKPVADTRVRISSSASDAAQAFAQQAGIAYLGTNDEGYGIYEINLSQP